MTKRTKTLSVLLFSFSLISGFHLFGAKAQAATAVDAELSIVCAQAQSYLASQGRSDLRLLKAIGCTALPAQSVWRKVPASLRAPVPVRDAPTATLGVRPTYFDLNFAEKDIRSVFIAKDSINVLGDFGTLQRVHGITLASPLGASVSGTIDQLKGSRSLALQGYFGVCLLCGNGGGEFSYSLGPALIANGNLADPFIKTAITPSALRIGPDMQVVYTNNKSASTWGINFDAMPFYQTDFRGLARMGGIQLLAEPTNEDLRLHAATCPKPTTGECAFSFNWRIIPEANIVDVQRVGQTLYTAARPYAWLGASVQASAYICQGAVVGCRFLPAPLLQLVSNLIPTVQYRYLTDAGGSGQRVSYFLAQVDYVIGQGKDSENGAATISFSYQSGIDELELQKSRQAKVSLSYKY